MSFLDDLRQARKAATHGHWVQIEGNIEEASGDSLIAQFEDADAEENCTLTCLLVNNAEKLEALIEACMIRHAGETRNPLARALAALDWRTE